MMTRREEELFIGWVLYCCDGNYSASVVQAACAKVNARLAQPLSDAEIVHIRGVIGAGKGSRRTHKIVEPCEHEFGISGRCYYCYKDRVEIAMEREPR